MTKTESAFDRNFLEDFQGTFKLDQRLFSADVRVNLTYCNALFHAGILTRAESERIKNGLQTILKRADYDHDYFGKAKSGNVHQFIENKLLQLVGDSAKKINLGRSVGEQTQTSLRIWLREKIVILSKAIKNLQHEILRISENHAVEVGIAKDQKTVFRAEWYLNYFVVWRRDRERLDEVWRRVNIFRKPLIEADELAEEIDFDEIARDLKFEGIVENRSDDALEFVFALEFVNVCSIIMLNLARLAEDLLLFANAESQIEIGEKKAVLEIISGKTSRVFSRQNALQLILRGFSSELLLSEIIEAVFDTNDSTFACLNAMQSVLRDLDFEAEKAASEDDNEKIRIALENARRELDFDE